MDALKDQSPIMLAFLGGLFTWGVTALGAALVFFFKSINRRVLDIMLGFAGGVMIAASFWSLLLPALDLAADEPMPWLRCYSGLMRHIRTARVNKTESSPAAVTLLMSKYGRCHQNSG